MGSNQVTVKQAVAANLKVDPSGVTSPVSIATAPVLVAGTALIGKVGIDQTTPGTTNAVQANAGTNLNTSALATVAKQPALGTAGTASTDVITVQGVTAGIPLASSLKTVVVTATPTLDTSAYATGDNLFGTAMVDLGAVVRANGGTGTIVGCSVLDISNPSGANNPASLEIYLFDTTGTIQAANAAAAFSDTVMAKCVEWIPVSLYGIVGAVNSFAKRDLWKPFKCASADTHLYMAVIVRGTPTYGASDLTFTFIVAQD